ncbi:MAG TPA: twin-arginine translocase TatA/TatE family subunit [Thermoanaerobaculia bacterium]|nr:twin-arginine translocase TatA/TatE family subunit [Thermoanaerobaculia bacterium]
MFGSLGVPELLLIFVVILIVFGPRRIPEIGKTLGKALGEFRKATDDLKSTIEREVRLEELKQVAPSIVTPFESISRFDPLATPEPVSKSEPVAATSPETLPDPLPESFPELVSRKPAERAEPRPEPDYTVDPDKRLESE